MEHGSGVVSVVAKGTHGGKEAVSRTMPSGTTARSSETTSRRSRTTSGVADGRRGPRLGQQGSSGCACGSGLTHGNDGWFVRMSEKREETSPRWWLG
jgi:hypothetical protein